MAPSCPLLHRELSWTYPDAEGRAFRLHAAGEEIGWLRFGAGPGSAATAELDGRRWIFAAGDGLHPHIQIRLEGSPETLAEFATDLTGGGVVTFAGGASFCWTRERLWSSGWCFRSRENKSKVCISQHTGALARGGKVSIRCDSADRAETPVLVLLAWYLRLLEFAKLSGSVALCG